MPRQARLTPGAPQAPGGAAIQVVAGVLADGDGRVLLAERRPGCDLAGLWEFPGGKFEPGEWPVDALARELREELGIVVESARPLIAVPHRYPGKDIVLHAWRVVRWSGSARAREGQRLAWVPPAALDRRHMPAADHAIVAALALPERCLLVPDLPEDDATAILAGIEVALARGIGMVELGLPGWRREALATLARKALGLCRAAGSQLVLRDDWRLAGLLGLDGVVLSPGVAAGLASRPLGADRWFGVACAGVDELAHALAIGADFARLGPVFQTPAMAGAPALGWEGLAELAAALPIPLHATGGLEAEDLDEALMAGAQGIAAGRAFWRERLQERRKPRTHV